MTPIKPKPPKHRLKRSEFVPGKPDKHTAYCGVEVTGLLQGRTVRSVMTISGTVTCAACLVSTRGNHEKR